MDLDYEFFNLDFERSKFSIISLSAYRVVQMTWGLYKSASLAGFKISGLTVNA